MDVIFNELALEEFNDAVSYYELEVSGLGLLLGKKLGRLLNESQNILRRGL